MGDTLSIQDKVLLAALKLSDGVVETTFTAEQLVVEAWKLDDATFGLRGFEGHYPDSNKLYTKIDGKSGIVSKGYLAKAGQRLLRLTAMGLARGTHLESSTDTDLVLKLDRTLQDAVNRVIDHPQFRAWLKNSDQPTRFRDAGHFWGIAPGTPGSAVQGRVLNIERSLCAALEVLDQRGIDEVAHQRGKLLFERHDIEQALEFQNTLKQRFKAELELLLGGRSL